MNASILYRITVPCFNNSVVPRVVLIRSADDYEE